MNIHEMLEAVKDLSGDYAECGVWKGSFAELIAKGMPYDTRLWLFDSFKGHAEPSEFDDKEKHPQGRYSDTNLADVMNRLPSGIVYLPVVGYIPETFNQVNGEKFRFVHIDVDHYWPTRAASEFFKSRMVSGGIIRFDDYAHGETPGATKAIDEVFGKANVLEGDYRWIAP